MIQKLREKLSGVVALGLIILIAIPLAFFGVESIFLNSTRVTTVAEVNGQEITDVQLSREVARQQNQLMEVLGENFDPAIFDSPALRAQALQRLVDRAVIYTEAESSGMGVSEDFVGSQILEMEQFQVGGNFSEVSFRNYLAQMGFTMTTFIEAMASDITTSQLAQGIQGSSPVTVRELGSLLALTRESRSYEYIRLSVEGLLSEVGVTDAEINDYYQANQSTFELPERVSVNYLELSVEQLISQVDVSEAEVEARLEAQRNQQSVERRVSHILVESGDSAQSTLEEIQGRLEQGEDFAELASEYSADVGSASQGGDLGFTDGSTFPDSFEQALAQLEVGEISGPVETDAGYHLIQLTELNESDFDEDAERQRIRTELRRAEAEDSYQRFFDSLQELAFSTDTLEQIQEQLGDQIQLDIQTSQPFSRDSGTGIAQNAALRSIAFSDIVLEDELNSEVIPLDGSNRAVVIHLNERWPQQIQPLEEVRDQIAAELRQQKATDLLAERASELLEEARQGTSLESISRREDLEWQVSLGRTRANLDNIGAQVFDFAVTEGLPVVNGFSLNNGDYVIAKLNDAEPGRLEALTQAQQESAKAGLRQSNATLEWAAYANALKSEANIDIDLDLPEEAEL